MKAYGSLFPQLYNEYSTHDFVSDPTSHCSYNSSSSLPLLLDSEKILLLLATTGTIGFRKRSQTHLAIIFRQTAHPFHQTVSAGRTKKRLWNVECVPATCSLVTSIAIETRFPNMKCGGKVLLPAKVKMSDGCYHSIASFFCDNGDSDRFCLLFVAATKTSFSFVSKFTDANDEEEISFLFFSCLSTMVA